MSMDGATQSGGNGAVNAQGAAAGSNSARLEPAITTMPALFIGHGSPMNAIERNRYSDTWRALGASLVRPRAILVISAHWFVNLSAVTAMDRPRVIHDFYGFPDELFAFDYPAPGSPALAGEIAEVVKPTWVGLDHDSWGLDHGTWSVLAHLFPRADIPVIQLSVHAQMPVEYHLDLGAKLAPLRDQGVLIVGSGNIVHNLRRLDWSQPEGGFDWAHRFDDATREIMSSEPDRLPGLVDHPDFANAVPTPDHFLPLAYIAGIAGAAKSSGTEGTAAHSASTIDVILDDCVMGSLSMTSYVIGAPELSSLS